MWFYLAIFYCCVIAYILNNLLTNNKSKVFIEISILIFLCVISGTRYYLGGSDYYVYLTIFNSIPKLEVLLRNFGQIDRYYLTFGVERGYLVFNSLVKTFGFNFFGFTLINSIIFYTCLYKGLKRYAYNFNLLIIVFLYKMFFYNTFISMRQSISIAIFFVAMHYIEERKPVKYFSYCILAALFHFSAIILFFVYFVNKIKLTKKKVIILNLIFIPTLIFSLTNFQVLKSLSFLAGVFANTGLFEKATDIFSLNSLTSISMLHVFEYFILMILIVVKFDKISNVNNHSEFILKIFLLLLPVFTIFRGYEIFTRLKDYFILSYAIILGNIFILSNRKYRTIMQIGVILVCLFGFIKFIVSFDNGAMMPYVSYLFK